MIVATTRVSPPASCVSWNRLFGIAHERGDSVPEPVLGHFPDQTKSKRAVPLYKV
jgi:hypothetical protein